MATQATTSPFERKRRLRALAKIYAEIDAWTPDTECVPRVLTGINPAARLAAVGEAYGPNTVRRSGVNYFSTDGTLGPTGKNLEEILNSLRLTLYPVQDIKLKGGAVIRKALGKGLETIYCTDICPEYPVPAKLRPGSSRGAAPSLSRILDALSKSFLIRELEIIRPEVLLLMGSAAYLSFYKHVLGRTNPAPLQTALSDLPTHAAHFQDKLVLPFWHPSPASPRFQAWQKSFRRDPMKNASVEYIRQALRGC